MNIQSYILPEWKKTISEHEMESDIEIKFLRVGESMAEYLDRYMMRTLPSNWYKGWTKFHFPLNCHELVIDLHKVIGTHFEEYIEKYRAGRKSEFSIPTDQINRIKLIEQRYEKILEDKETALDIIRKEIKSGRRKVERKKKTIKKDVSQHKKAKKEAPSTIQVESFDHDSVYKKWMEMVESKPISKSYWHIHEYISRYIMDWAKKHTDDGIVTKQVIEDFLADYGKGKRPKTMNHYNRVVYRFWDFYQELTNPEGDELKVW